MSEYDPMDLELALACFLRYGDHRGACSGKKNCTCGFNKSYDNALRQLSDLKSVSLSWSFGRALRYEQIAAIAAGAYPASYGGVAVVDPDLLCKSQSEVKALALEPDMPKSGIHDAALTITSLVNENEDRGDSVVFCWPIARHGKDNLILARQGSSLSLRFDKHNLARNGHISITRTGSLYTQIGPIYTGRDLVLRTAINKHDDFEIVYVQERDGTELRVERTSLPFCSPFETGDLEYAVVPSRVLGYRE